MTSAREPTKPGEPGDEPDEFASEAKLIPPRGPLLEGASFLARLQDEFGDAVDPEISLQEDESAPGESGAGRDGTADEDSGAETEQLLAKLSEKDAQRIRYRIKGEIARGGMGAILRVWDDDLRRNLAMKVLLSRRGDDDLASQREGEVDQELLSRFLEEAQITGQLDHPGIVPVHDLGLDARGRVYFTMRLVRGRDLKSILDLLAKGEQGWTLTKALHVVLKVCEAMAFAHSKGVVHRDLKPANIMVGRFGETYVMDWGLARVLGRRDSHDMRLKPADASALSLVRTARRTDARSDEAKSGDGDAKSPLVTMDGDVIGTPSFMSVEQALGKLEEVGPRSDVYSLGSILYQILAGHAPYVKPDAKIAPHTVLLSVIDGPPTPVDVANPNVPGELAAICNKAMARDADARYPTMLLMAADIEAFLEGRVVSAYEAGPFAEARKWVQRNRGLAATTALAALLAMGGIAGVIAVQVTKASELQLANLDLTAAKTIAEQKERQALEAQAAATAAAQEAEAAEADAKEQAELAEANAAIAKARSYMSDVRAAEYTLRLRQVGETLGLLARTDPDQRGWEWAHLNLRSQSQLGPPAHRTTPLAVLARTNGGRVLVVMDYGQLEAYEAGPGGLASKRKLGDKLWAVGRPEHVDFGLDPTGEVAAVIGRKPGAVVLLSASGIDAEPVPDPADLFEPYELVEGDGGWLPPLELDVPATRGAEPTRLAFGPRDDLLAVGYDNGVVLLWDHAARDLLFALGDEAAGAAPGAPDRAVTALAWSPDGRRLVATSADGRLRGWDADSGEERLAHDAHEGAALAVAYAPLLGGASGSGLVATGGADGLVRLWRASDGAPIARHAAHTGPVRSLAFRPDVRALASGGDDTTLQTWDLDEASARLEAGGSERATLAGPREVSALLGHEGAVSALAYSADGAMLFSAGRDGSLRAWDPEYGGPVTELVDGRYTRPGADVKLVQVTAVDIHPNGWMCLTGHADGSIAIWDSLRGELHDVLRAQHAAITRARWSPDGSAILSASIDKSVVLYDVAARRERAVFQHTERVIDATFSPDQRFVVTACADDVAHVFQTATGAEQFRLEGHEGWVNAVLVTPDGREIWTASREGKLRRWHAATGALLNELDCGSEIRTLAQSEDGRLLATGLTDGRVAVLDTVKWRELAEGAGNPAPGAAEDSPWLFDKEVIQNGDPITALAFSHAPSDGETARLVLGSNDGNVRIYHARTGDLLLTLRGQGDNIAGLAFSPDDTRLLSGASRLGHQGSFIGPGESAARIWETGQTAQRRTARREAARIEREADVIVQTLFATFFSTERVLRNLPSWPMEDDVRRAATRLARVRRDDGARLAEESLRAVLPSSAGEERRADALGIARSRAEVALDLEPTSPFCLVVLAAAQLRTGAAETALRTLERIDDAKQELDARAGALRDAFAALAHDALGHADEARAAYEAFTAREVPPELEGLAAELIARFQAESGGASASPGAPEPSGVGGPAAAADSGL